MYAACTLRKKKKKMHRNNSLNSLRKEGMTAFDGTAFSSVIELCVEKKLTHIDRR